MSFQNADATTSVSPEEIDALLAKRINGETRVQFQLIVALSASFNAIPTKVISLMYHLDHFSCFEHILRGG